LRIQNFLILQIKILGLIMHAQMKNININK
jgi:hypothetical protein